MNDAHLHLILVHIPIVIVPAGLAVLLFGMWRKKRDIINTALALFLASAVIVVPAFLIGEEAEEIVEDLPGISESLIEDHEERADLALWCTLFLGALSIATFVVEKKKPTLYPIVLKSVVIVSIASAVLLALTGQAGGMIRHPEAFSEKIKGAED